jgi:hypothetical protein
MKNLRSGVAVAGAAAEWARACAVYIFNTWPLKFQGRSTETGRA